MVQASITSGFDPLDRSSWSSLVGNGSISQSIDLGAIRRLSQSDAERRARASALRDDGFFAADSVLAPSRCERMRDAIECVRRHGRHELFALLCDEFWIALAETSGSIEEIFGVELRAVPTPYVNYVPAGDRGFGAHRDRYAQPLADDGLPEAVTIWTALTHASTERACLAMLPTRYDPSFPDNLREHRISDIRDVRALPVSIGSFICFNLAVLHWGTRNASDEPRVSFAFELARPNAVKNAVTSVNLHAPLSFSERLRFLGTVVELLRANRIVFSEADLAFAARMVGA